MITTHVLDTARGKPAVGVPLLLELAVTGGWQEQGRGVTDADGRCRTLLAGRGPAGVWRLTFDISAYEPGSFYPSASVVFRVRDDGQHYHVPLLLSPFGYSTYRGS
jgi:5-hydroxyisourate hydrolase